LYYEEEGNPDFPVLILSNSLGTNLSMWDAQVEAWSTVLRLLRYDSRGHGRSSIPDGPYTIEQMGRDVLNLADALGYERFHFCGLSIGGMVGQWLGIHAPGRLLRLVLSNTASQIGTTEMWSQRIETVNAEGMRAVTPAILVRWYTEQFLSEHSAEVASTAAMLNATSPKGYTASCAAIRDMDQQSAVHLITTPTLVVFGDADAVTPPSKAHELTRSIARARSLELHAAHLSNIEASAEYTAGVGRFLTEKP
jgi:3-oxoadipate enol-lactonase